MWYNQEEASEEFEEGEIMQMLFSENLKKYRLARGLTQEQAAQILNVNPQTVSRWECAATLPDALMLPRLSELYGVTVDDLYKKNTVAYDNYAQRLASVFENSRDPEDFMRSRTEYKKLMEKGELSTQDKWTYAWIHMYMMNFCRDEACEWYDKAVSDDPEKDPQNYALACMQRIWMFFLLHKEEEILSELEEKRKNSPDDPRATDNLLLALIWAERFDEAYGIFTESVKKFPDDWRMYIYGGDIAKNLKKYDEALSFYDKAGEIGTYFCDEMDCRAGLFEETGEFERSYNEYMKMAEIYRSRGYDVEADTVEKSAARVKKKIEDMK